MTESFDDYVRELEARATPEELALLEATRAAMKDVLARTERKIKRRERIEAFVATMNDTYEAESVTLHEWPDDVFNHDGPCVEIKPRYCGGMSFTTLLFKAEIWGTHANGERVTENPLCVKGATDDEVIDCFISYIDGWIFHHTEG